jgi:hypothetical protein
MALTGGQLCGGGGGGGGISGGSCSYGAGFAVSISGVVELAKDGTLRFNATAPVGVHQRKALGPTVPAAELGVCQQRQRGILLLSEGTSPQILGALFPKFQVVAPCS